MMRKVKNKYYFRVGLRDCQRRSALDGFTIVELLVSMGVFVVLLGIIVTIFINSLRSQQAMVAFMATNDNASLTLEQMAREMRTGTDFNILPITPPLSFGDTIGFLNANSEIISYRLNITDQTIERGKCSLPSNCTVPGGYDYKPISGASVKINSLKFFIVVNQFSLPPWPPRITITLEVGSNHPRLQGVTTKIQTTISARNI